MATKEECLRVMKEITNKAREEECLLEIPGDGTVFTPAELDALNQEGRYIWANWGNWRLLTPEAYLARHKRQFDNALQDYGEAAATIARFKFEQVRWKATKGG